MHQGQIYWRQQLVPGNTSDPVSGEGRKTKLQGSWYAAAHAFPSCSYTCMCNTSWTCDACRCLQLAAKFFKTKKGIKSVKFKSMTPKQEAAQWVKSKSDIIFARKDVNSSEVLSLFIAHHHQCCAI